MLRRYTMHRGQRPEGDPLPDGIRQDTRKHTRHILRPEGEWVEAYLRGDGSMDWPEFTKRYRDCLEQRFKKDRENFEDLASLAAEKDVYIGCSCPTKKNPDVNCCHTVLALEFMKGKFPDLPVEFP